MCAVPISITVKLWCCGMGWVGIGTVVPELNCCMVTERAPLSNTELESDIEKLFLHQANWTSAKEARAEKRKVNLCDPLKNLHIVRILYPSYIFQSPGFTDRRLGIDAGSNELFCVKKCITYEKYSSKLENKILELISDASSQVFLIWSLATVARHGDLRLETWDLSGQKHVLLESKFASIALNWVAG